MHPEITDTVLSTYLFFQQEIPPGSRSGRMKFQGNQVIYILEGRGYTLLDGVRHDWQAGDLINLPIKIAGIVVQHVNLDAEKRVRKIQNADGVRNRIEVASSVHDEILRDQLSDKLRYDRIGYGIVFNNLTLSVENGVATVAGKVRDYPDRDSAIAIVETTPGVKDVIDEIEVAPTSINDDRLRIALARSIYGNSALEKYAIDPQAPIRIVVENGNVELHGVVTSKLDKQAAYMQASSVPGVFSVKNNIMVASEMNR
jgi:osmotically-inducible protein OsmY